jgi:ubiquitin fusion degradation protein 1
MFGFPGFQQQGGFFQGGFGGPPGRFDHQYQAYPVSFIGKDDLEKGNKIILPPSALDHLARLNISYPMLFEISNPNAARTTCCGVHEFIAEEGTCYLPYWMMTNLCMAEGELIRVLNVSLSKGTYVKLQPVSSDFLVIHNPRAVLENTLRHFATLTVGDCIVIMYNSNKYEIEIVECKPSNRISIIEADINVDFAEPKFTKEEHKTPAPAAYQSYTQQEDEDEPMLEAPEPASKVFSGSGTRVDGKPIKASSPAHKPSAPPVIDEFAHTPWKKKIPGGVKYRIAPFGYGDGHMTGKQLGSTPASSLLKGKDMYEGKGQTLED